MSERQKMLLIINPVAGKLRTQSADIPGFFPAYDVEVYYTKDGASTELFVEKCAASFDLVVCAGGDGTLNRVINGLMRLSHRPPLGYIPCGTTNDFAASLGISRDISRAADTICKGRIQKIDIGSFGNRFFTYVASFGAFTESSYKAPQENKNRLGHMAYIFEAVRDLPNIRPCRLHVETEYTSFSGEYVFGAISNSTSLGGMLRLSPDSVLYDDGLFEVMLISMPHTALDLQQIIFSLVRRNYHPDYVTFFKTNHVVFSMDEIFPWSLDGEFEPGDHVVHIENNRRAISLFLP